MCGICGKLDFNGRPVGLELIKKMNSRMVHRGPDEEGTYLSPEKNAALGMRRLKIIDLSTGSQPIFNETGDIAVVLNGEIYNYIELRSDLEKLGHVFKTHSDTETLVHAYESWGTEFLSRLNGMFAIALWDDKKKNLLLARDRSGIKPLYYRASSAGISFGSEIKVLLADPECAKEIDANALDDYFSLLYVPGPNSIFKDIKKLEPGHFLICDAGKKTVEKRLYWRKTVSLEPRDLGWGTYKEQLDLLFRDALKLQLRSDVPCGVFLSSGLDSGAIAYYASQVSSQKIKTFTVHFDEESYSERAGAKSISEACGTEHFEMELHPDARDIVLKTAEFFDEPFADNSAIPTYLLCGFARERITVALSGEGGDELFGGYPTYLATKYAGAYRKMPALLRKAVRSAVEKLPVSWERISLDYKMKQFVRGAECSPERAHFAWKEIFGEEDKRALYSAAFQKARGTHDGFESFQKLFEEVGNGTELEKLLFVDQYTYLADQFLVKSDRMSMAHSLEVRVPILDHRMIEFAGALPDKYKLRGAVTKWAFRGLLEGKLPKPILSAAKKGFSPPIPAWLAGSLRPFLEEVLSEESIRKTGVLDPAYVRKLMDEHWSRKRDHHRRLWAVMNFVLWHNRWA